MSNKVLMIAEIGASHQGDTFLGCELIEAAKEVGADIAKFQLYDVDTIKKPGDTNYEELKKVQLSKDDMFLYSETCERLGIEFGASVFSIDRLEWTDEIEIKRIKLASRSLLTDDLKKEVLKRFKPIISSVQPDLLPEGVSLRDLYPLEANVDLLYCLSRRKILRDGITDFPSAFGKSHGFTGFSDHTVGNQWAHEALLRGATVIEKHFTFDLNAPGWDNPSAATPEMFKELVDHAKRV